MTLSIRSITYQDNPQQKPACYNFSLNTAEFVGLVGANGSGKSTLIKLLTGEYLPSSGDLLFEQVSLIKQPEKFKSSLGYMPDIFAIDQIFSVKQFLEYVIQCKQLEPAQAEQCITQLLADFNLNKLQNLPVSKLSLGQRQKVNLAQALAGNPRLLLLDEPLNGLDPIEQQNFWQLLNQYQPSYLLIASHHLQDLQQRCDRILIIDSHTIVANIDLLKSQFLIALNKTQTKHESTTNHARLLACQSEQEFETLCHSSSGHIVYSGDTLSVLNELFRLQAEGAWQW